ncbi:hypothetical protein Leryth_007386 [Lithospermum erythrorhizon]|nr:hypothetical protein Leryth_007386 [Lithospermum erythrorhizon]
MKLYAYPSLFLVFLVILPRKRLFRRCLISIDKYLTKSADDAEVVSEFLQLVKYVSGSYDTPEETFLSCTSTISISTCLQNDQNYCMNKC